MVVVTMGMEKVGMGIGMGMGMEMVIGKEMEMEMEMGMEMEMEMGMTIAMVIFEYMAWQSEAWSGVSEVSDYIHHHNIIMRQRLADHHDERIILWYDCS